VTREGQDVDITVAAQPLAPGDVALRMPEHLIVTLDRVFEDNTLAELLTTNKLSGAGRRRGEPGAAAAAAAAPGFW
jgi:histone-lysine N-methyltransferase SETD3